MYRETKSSCIISKSGPPKLGLTPQEHQQFVEECSAQSLIQELAKYGSIICQFPGVTSAIVGYSSEPCKFGHHDEKHCPKIKQGACVLCIRVAVVNKTFALFVSDLLLHLLGPYLPTCVYIGSDIPPSVKNYTVAKTLDAYLVSIDDLAPMVDEKDYESLLSHFVHSSNRQPLDPLIFSELPIPCIIRKFAVQRAIKWFDYQCPVCEFDGTDYHKCCRKASTDSSSKGICYCACVWHICYHTQDQCHYMLIYPYGK
jgi:hypothetical protein